MIKRAIGAFCAAIIAVTIVTVFCPWIETWKVGLMGAFTALLTLLVIQE